MLPLHFDRQRRGKQWSHVTYQVQHLRSWILFSSCWLFSPLFFIPFFHVFSLVMHSLSVSAITARSSAYSSSQGTPVRNSCERASSTSIKSRGLRTEPWCTPSPNSSLYCPFTLTLLKLYQLCMGWPIGMKRFNVNTVYQSFSKVLISRSIKKCPGKL